MTMKNTATMTIRSMPEELPLLLLMLLVAVVCRVIGRAEQRRIVRQTYYLSNHVSHVMGRLKEIKTRY